MYMEENRLTSKPPASLPPVDNKQLQHWRKHCKAQEEEEADTPILHVSSIPLIELAASTDLVFPLVEPFLKRQV